MILDGIAETLKIALSTAPIKPENAPIAAISVATVAAITILREHGIPMADAIKATKDVLERRAQSLGRSLEQAGTEKTEAVK